MFSYLKGIVSCVDSNFITVDVNGIGFLVYTPNSFGFIEGNEYIIYIYHHIREDEMSLYGFKTMDEKDLFLKLIGVKGLGPRMALPIVAMGSVSGISDAINRENILYLKKFPKIGDKLAKQMILDLKGKLEVGSNDSCDEELIDVLRGLGYKDKDIKGIVNRVDKSCSLEDQVKEALRLLVRL